MWLHLQSDDTIGSAGFKAVYEGMTPSQRNAHTRALIMECESHDVADVEIQ